jgi:DNA-binding NarL/FixJ family response regulator
MQQIEVILADPSPVVILGFRKIFEKHPRVRVIQEVSTLSGLQAATAVYTGGVAIVDWQMTSLETATQVAEKTKLILSAMPESIGTRRYALRIGARGLIGKDQSPADIRRAVLTVASGRIWLGKTTAEAILNDELSGGIARRVDSDLLSRLTTRERQVIQMACRELKSREIALELRISEPTLSHHFTSIYSKLGVKDRIGLIICAFRHSLHLPEMQTYFNETPNSFQPPEHR